MSVWLYPYRMSSKGGKLLAEAMGIKRIRRQGSKLGWRPKTIINWGSTSYIPWRVADKWINRPDCVILATNKLLAFQKMQEAGVSIPPWTTDIQVAREWLKADKTVVERHILNGAEGKGIEIVKPFQNLQPAPLHVQYIPKKKEFRVHIVDGKVIDTQQKVRKRDAEGPGNFLVRNTANGFVFVRDGIAVPPDAHIQAIAAVRALGLDFGAVDVIWNEKQNKSYVLEVNTAPGIEGSTVTKYKEALSALCNM